MKNVVLSLLSLCLILFTFIGCQPVPEASEKGSITGNDSEFSESVEPGDTAPYIKEFEQDDRVIKKLLDIYTSLEPSSAALPNENPTMKEEFAALVKDVRIDDEEYVLTIDKIEPTYSSDISDDFFTNDEIVDEEIVVKLIDAENIAFIVDPHNSFSSVTYEGFKTYIQAQEGSFPFYFYSINGELVLLFEMMLP